MSELSHIDNTGKAYMVDVGNKPVQYRMAKASGEILLSFETLELIRSNLIKKGDVIAVAEIAGIQAAKKTSELIPLCHPLQITKIDVKTNITNSGIVIESIVKCIGQTGVEMEALTAVNIALLTIYDMCKAVDKNMVIQNIRLTEKSKKDTA
ncbi:MAG: cyclic pyranopterin monophosphate synthase MoaC [Bacteroidales bacterium]|nr:cyclic pyranopterin monophosphate synthase MoaC [Bacteroidales bacterium]